MFKEKFKNRMIRMSHHPRKLRALNAFTILICFFVIIMKADKYPDWKDRAAIDVGAIGTGVAIVGACVTSPVWGKALLVGGGVVTIAGLGIRMWDMLDDSEEPDVCKRCGVYYKRGGPHYCIMDYTHREGSEQQDAQYGEDLLQWLEKVRKAHEEIKPERQALLDLLSDMFPSPEESLERSEAENLEFVEKVQAQLETLHELNQKQDAIMQEEPVRPTPPESN